MRYARSRKPSPFKGKQAYKHVVTYEVQGNFDAAVTTADLIRGVDNPTITNETYVASGAKVIGMYIELLYSFHLVPAGIATNDLHWVIYYSAQGLVTGTSVDPMAQGQKEGKAYVIKSGVLSIDKATSNVAKVVGYIPIPPKYQKFMTLDRMRLAFRSSLVSGPNSPEFLSFKGVYKELRG